MMKMKRTELKLKPRRVQLISLGCSKNRVDSEHILRQLEGAGISIAPESEDLSSGGVDTVVINTCGFIKDAKQESIDVIFSAVEAKQRGFISHILVFGCLSQRYMDELVAEIPEVDGFFGALDNDSLLEALSVVRRRELDQQRYLTTPSHYAYLKISEGCDRVCSYCSIPLIRGKHRSVPVEELVAEAEGLAAKGVRELIVIAQDTTYYGLDLYGKRMLGELLRKLAAVEGIDWIRLHYSYPAAFPDDVLDVMATEPKMCRYLDIPLQHISTKVLSMMRRSIDGPQTKALVRRFRERVPGIVLRTTMIVGHPGEDSREFRKLLDFVKDASFERLGAFTYSEEEGTYGARTFTDSVRESTKQKRYDMLMEAQSQVSLDYNLSRVGTEETVIVDEFSDGVFVTRSRYESPEVDGQILVGIETLSGKDSVTVFTHPDDAGEKMDVPDIMENPAVLAGRFIRVSVTGADEYDLIAEFI